MSDPFSISIVQAGLANVAEEMFSVLRKTAMSPIIYEVLDVGTGLTDDKGRLIGSGAGIPTFVGVLDKAVQTLIKRFGDTIAEGDIFITNDPNFGGVTHLNDVVIAKPVFFNRECVAWTASIAHWGDIGGKVPGSMATDVTEIFAEGLRIPSVRIFNAGIPVRAVFDIIKANSRTPDFVQGDLWAQISACKSAEKQVLNLLEKYGLETFTSAISDAFKIARAYALEGLSKIPNGCYKIEEKQDNNDLWRASITVSDEKFIVDLRGNPKEIDAPYNTSRDGAVISCQMIFKALCDPGRFANYGSFSPLEVITENNTIFHASSNVPQGYYFETRIRLFDMLCQCMAKALPDLLPAGSFSSIFGTVIAGFHPETGRRYIMVEPQMGGWGATQKRNGMDAMFSINHGDTFNCPVEICEARYGLNVIKKSLSERPQQSVRYKGGRGVMILYEVRSDASLSVGYTRGVVPVWSLNNAAEGGKNSMCVIRNNREKENYQFVSGLDLRKGDLISIKTAFGGNS